VTIQPVLPAGTDVSEDRIDSLLMYRVAACHFQERLSNLEISRVLGISRFRVARLLEQAMDNGVVELKIDLPVATDDDLAGRLAQQFGLADAKVLAEGGDELWRRDAVSALAITHTGTLLSDGGLLGIAWGRTLDAVARVGSHLKLSLPRADVVQLVGGVPSETGSLDASDLVRRFSLLTGGRSLVLNAPLIVPTLEIVRGLEAERSIAETLAAGRNASVALFGVGAWRPDQSALWNLLDEDRRTAVAQSDAVADICGILLTPDGSLAQNPLAEQTVGIKLETLRGIPRRVAVAIGVERTEAIAAALRAEAVTDLVVEAEVARALLDG
jgi:DNA-binding transcriptional regulator LsrR (DeoR family)